MVLKLGDRYRDVLPYGIEKGEIPLVSILLRAIPVLRLNSSSRHHSDIDRRMLLVGLCRHFVFPKNYSESGSTCVGWHNILSWSLAKCAKRSISVIFFFISLKSSSSISVQFHSNFFRRSCLIRSSFYESSGSIFAMSCIGPRNDFNASHDIVGFTCNIALISSLFGFFPCSVVSCPSRMVSLRSFWNLLRLPCIRLLGDVSVFFLQFFVVFVFFSPCYYYYFV